MIRDHDLDTRGLPVKNDRRVIHDWSLPSAHPLIDDPAVQARLEKAIALRQAERERELRMRPAARKAFNKAMEDQRAIAFNQIFDLKPGAWFPFQALSPSGRRACRCGCGRGCDSSPTLRDRDAGLDHYDYYRRRGRPMAIVAQPYRAAFEYGKREGAVAEVERERGIRILELNPLLGWYSNDPVDLPTALVVWTRP
jgi:hypothetical protein